MNALSGHLPIDRLAEFQRIAQERSTTTQPAAKNAKDKLWFLQKQGDDSAGAPVAGGGGGFMREFFASVSEIQVAIKQGREGVQGMGSLIEDVLQATTRDRQQAASNRLAQATDEINGHIASASASLQALKAKADTEEQRQPNSTEGKIRSNMQHAMARKHQHLVLDFQKTQMNFKQVLEQREAREMQLLIPDASEDDVHRMIQEGQTSSHLMVQKMAGIHANIHEEVQRIREKHNDILKLEQSISDLAQMFQEMAVLIETQGEMIDSIEMNVHNTNTYMCKAEKQLVTTRKLQISNRKWMCCTTFCCLLVALAIFGPIIVKAS